MLRRSKGKGDGAAAPSDDAAEVAAAPPLPWWRTTSIYQVYPRSFADSNGDGIGDLPGIIDHLDHLVDLGVGAVWVSPFFASPQRDVGYDVSDYRAVAPEYGTLDDAQRLIDEAHARGLKVLFDLVLNHTSDEHPWFVESRSSRTNPKADWYVWADPRTSPAGRRRPPNNWRSELQLTKPWQWCPEREQWYLATFLPFQPDLNWRHPEVREEMFGMIRMWLGRGVDGFRLDIFGSIMHDAQLRDNDPRPRVVGGIPRLQTPIHTLNTDENFELACDLRAVVDEFDGDRALLGEVFGDEAVLRNYLEYGGRPGLHMVFLFEFLAARYSAKRYRELIARFEREFPDPMLPTYVVENHDRTRSLSRLGGDLDRARVLATLLMTLRGVPVVYQGQEIGMTNKYIPLREANDPIPGVIARYLPEAANRRLTERLNRDEVRTPMQWTSAAHVGFCPDDVEPWLPVNDDRLTRNVADQAGDPDSLMTLYQALLELRRATPALHRGSLTLRETDVEPLVMYERRHEGEQVLVMANLGDERLVVSLEAPVVAPMVGGEAEWSIALATSDRVELKSRLVLLPRHAAVILSAG